LGKRIRKGHNTVTNSDKWKNNKETSRVNSLEEEEEGWKRVEEVEVAICF